MSTNYQTIPISDAGKPLIVAATSTATSIAATTATTSWASSCAASFKPSEWISSATPALQACLTRILEAVRILCTRTKPWSELFSFSSFSKPASLSDAVARIRKNFSYFRTNYVTLLVVVLTLSYVSNFTSLFILLVLLALWCVFYVFRPSDKPVILFGRTISKSLILSILVILSIGVVYITPVGYTLTSALTIGLLVACIHGAFRDPSDLFLDENEPPVSGLVAAALDGSSTSAVNGSVVPHV